VSLEIAAAFACRREQGLQGDATAHRLRLDLVNSCRHKRSQYRHVRVVQLGVPVAVAENPTADATGRPGLPYQLRRVLAAESNRSACVQSRVLCGLAGTQSREESSDIRSFDEIRDYPVDWAVFHSGMSIQTAGKRPDDDGGFGPDGASWQVSRFTTCRLLLTVCVIGWR
jgi:hypothetical protein